MRVRPDLVARPLRQLRYSDIALTLRLRLRAPRQRGAVMDYATVGWRIYVLGCNDWGSPDRYRWSRIENELRSAMPWVSSSNVRSGGELEAAMSPGAVRKNSQRAAKTLGRICELVQDEVLPLDGRERWDGQGTVRNVLGSKVDVTVCRLLPIAKNDGPARLSPQRCVLQWLEVASGFGAPSRATPQAPRQEMADIQIVLALAVACRHKGRYDEHACGVVKYE